MLFPLTSCRIRGLVDTPSLEWFKFPLHLHTMSLRTSSNASFSNTNSPFPCWPSETSWKMLSGALPINSQGSSNTECPEAAALNYNQELNFRRWHQQQLPASPYELIISCIFRSYSIGENDSIKVCGLLSDKPLAQVNKMVKYISIAWNSRSSSNMENFPCREAVCCV